MNQASEEELLTLTVSTETGQTGWSFPGEVIESLRAMVTRISRSDNFPPRLAIVAARRGEGVTYIAQALAAQLANDLAARICLVDLNWWWPSTSPFAGADNTGLAAVLKGEETLDHVISPTAWANLAVVPAGKLDRRDRPVLTRSDTLKMVIEDLGSRFDHLIMDIPAILATNDAVPLASLASTCCVVVRHGDTKIVDVQQALAEIDHLSVLGVVMNSVKFSTPQRISRLLS